MIDAGSTTLNNKWKNVLHNQAEDYIIPESDVNVMCPYDCLSTSGYTVSSYSPESICNPNTLASAPTTINRDKKIATFEWNFWVLDGSFDVLDTGETYNGYMSSNISGADCTFSVNPYVFLDHLTFNQRKNQTIKFAPAYNQVPAEIELFTAYGSTVNSIIYDIEEMLETDDIQNQEYVHLYSDDIDTTFSASRVGITTRKTLMPYRRARVTEYNNGYKFFKSKHDLLTFTHTRSVSLAMDELPQNDLQFSFTDLEGIYDSLRTDAPFRLNFNNNHRFYVYYGYNFDDIGWNYVQADYLVLENIEINRESIETIFNLQSVLQIYNTKYDANNLDTIQYINGSYHHSKSAPYNWTTFKGFMTAIKTRLGIGEFTYSTNDIDYLNFSMEEWQNYLRATTTADSENAFTKLPLKEVIQQICAFLRCALVRQADGSLRLEYLYPSTFNIVDSVEASNIIAYPTKTNGEQYKYVSISTPKTYSEQSDDEEVTGTAGSYSIVCYPASKRFTVSNASGSEETSVNQNIIPLNYKEGTGTTSCWLWSAGIWQNYANHYWKVKKSTRYEFGELMLNPLLQVADPVRLFLGDNYNYFDGLIEKIEINYDGSFKGALNLCLF